MPERSRARILVADDFEDAREMYAEMLEHAGYLIVTARDGSEVLDALARAPFDLVLLDIAMPKVDGITLIRILRGKDATRDLPIITVSALAGEDMRQTILSAGADAALDKPCLPAEIEAAVRYWLDRRARERRERAQRDPAA